MTGRPPVPDRPRPARSRIVSPAAGAPHAAERMVPRFAAALRSAGVVVPVASAIDFAQSLALVGIDDPDRAYWAGRATLVRRPEDVPVYDRVWSAFWGRAAALPLGLPSARNLTLALDEESGAGDPAGPDPAGDVRTVRYSSVEVLRHRDLATLSPEEWAEARRTISTLRVSAEQRPSRRSHATRRRRGDRPDLRATVRRNMRRGGLPVELSWRQVGRVARRMVLLLDVSGSMEAYARGLALFAHAAVASRRAGQVEVFTIGTRLTRVTREMGRRDPDVALAEVAASVEDWSGGTRLGESIGEFNDRWGVRGLARGAVVVICSDGWDRGDPDVVAAEMARLALVSHRVIWVNPLKASPGYAPLARGMAAALPYVDLFVEGHSVASLEQLARLVGAPGRAPQRAGDLTGVVT